MLRRCLLGVLAFAGSTLTAPGHGPGPTRHPHQGLADMLLEYMAVRYKGVELQGDVLYVSIARQMMYHVRSGSLLNSYPISTARNGLGTQRDSYRTPTGLHQIGEKIGDGVPLYGILKDRRSTGALANPAYANEDQDLITTRILWLDGLEPGHNRGGNVDTRHRSIYIHGTASEHLIGQPVSHGCIRMCNHDVLELFERVHVGALVVVLDN